MQVRGFCDPAFARVREVFSDAVKSGAERGAVCLRHKGQTALNLWGGAADPDADTPWKADTLACCFSVTKGVFALLAQRLIDIERIGLDVPVARYWPAFAQGGKADITVRDLLSHRAGLPAVDGPVHEGSLYDTKDMESLLEASGPVAPPEAGPVYHNMTYGYLVGGLCARATGIPVRDLIRTELTDPIGADFRIGLSKEDQARCATLTQDDPEALFVALDDAPESIFARSMAFFARGENFNSRLWREAVIGSGNGHANAEGLAKVYEQFTNQSVLLSEDRRTAIRRQICESVGDDPILGIPIRYGEGVELSSPPHIDFGPNPSAVGYWGAGGAQAFADHDADLSFGYVTGRMDAAMGSSDRARALVDAVYECLRRAEKGPSDDRNT